MMDVVGMLREYSRLKQTVERALESLEEDEQLIVEKMYIVPKIGNLEYICQELGVEKSTVYRRRDRAMHKLGALLEISKAGIQAGIQEEKTVV